MKKNTLVFVNSFPQMHAYKKDRIYWCGDNLTYGRSSSDPHIHFILRCRMVAGNIFEKWRSIHENSLGATLLLSSVQIPKDLCANVKRIVIVPQFGWTGSLFTWWCVNAISSLWLESVEIVLSDRHAIHKESMSECLSHAEEYGEVLSKYDIDYLDRCWESFCWQYDHVIGDDKRVLKVIQESRFEVQENIDSLLLPSKTNKKICRLDYSILGAIECTVSGVFSEVISKVMKDFTCLYDRLIIERILDIFLLSETPLIDIVIDTQAPSAYSGMNVKLTKSGREFFYESTSIRTKFPPMWIGGKCIYNKPEV